MDDDTDHAEPAHGGSAGAAGEPGGARPDPDLSADAAVVNEAVPSAEHRRVGAHRRGRGSAPMYLVQNDDEATATAVVISTESQIKIEPSGVTADHPVRGSTALDTDDDGARDSPGGDDWPWVAEWRAGGEPTPWAMGLVLAAFSALIVAVAIWVLSAGLADRPIVAVLVNVVVASGLAPAMWLSRGLPVLRWIGGGALAGILCGWASALLLLPAPR